MIPSVAICRLGRVVVHDRTLCKGTSRWIGGACPLFSPLRRTKIWWCRSSQRTELISYIWQKLFQYQNLPEEKEYWDELIKEVFLFLRLFSENSLLSDKSATRELCISFLSSISISDYLATKELIENGNMLPYHVVFFMYATMSSIIIEMMTKLKSFLVIIVNIQNLI